jgi:GNAT superfamily N-acetyltransferase
VDDLVTAEAARGRGHGRALLKWLAQRALAEGVPRLYLDSRNTAKTFYEKLGFEFSTSIPCYIELT